MSVSPPERLPDWVLDSPRPTRARYPDEEGYVERDGVRVFWERHGARSPTLLLVPP